MENPEGVEIPAGVEKPEGMVDDATSSVAPVALIMVVKAVVSLCVKSWDSVVDGR